MNIIQIIPRLPPAVDGVGDYAYHLARQLRVAHGIHTQFVVCDPAWKKATSLISDPPPVRSGSDEAAAMNLDGFPIFQLKERSADELQRVLSAAGMPLTVLLQYVGYGYEKRGCPVWLMRALRAWKNSRQTISETSAAGQSLAPRRLVTMFHELYAFGPPWSSSFWTSPLQRWIAKSLASLSAGCLTNRTASAVWLSSGRQIAREAIPILPVFSNVGEPNVVPPWSARKPQMVIYGGVSRERADYQLATEAVRRACQNLQLESVVAIGRKTVDSALGLPVKNAGVLPAAEMTRLLLESRVGYLDYYDGYLAKSGIFAAYCAHGLAPLLLRKNHSEADGLQSGQHFLVANHLSSPMDNQPPAQIAARAYQWYGSHSVNETARIMAGQLIH